MMKWKKGNSVRLLTKRRPFLGVFEVSEKRIRLSLELLVYMVSGTRDNPPPSYPGRGNF